MKGGNMTEFNVKVEVISTTTIISKVIANSITEAAAIVLGTSSDKDWTKEQKLKATAI
jgi:hypothetical protein